MTDKDGNSKQGSVKNNNGDNPKEKASRNNIEGIMYGLTGGLFYYYFTNPNVYKINLYQLALVLEK